MPWWGWVLIAAVGWFLFVIATVMLVGANRDEDEYDPYE